MRGSQEESEPSRQCPFGGLADEAKGEHAPGRASARARARAGETERERGGESARAREGERESNSDGIERARVGGSPTSVLVIKKLSRYTALSVSNLNESDRFQHDKVLHAHVVSTPIVILSPARPFHLKKVKLILLVSLTR